MCHNGLLTFSLWRTSEHTQVAGGPLRSKIAAPYGICRLESMPPSPTTQTTSEVPLSDAHRGLKTRNLNTTSNDAAFCFCILHFFSQWILFASIFSCGFIVAECITYLCSGIPGGRVAKNIETSALNYSEVKAEWVAQAGMLLQKSSDSDLICCRLNQFLSASVMFILI